MSEDAKVEVTAVDIEAANGCVSHRVWAADIGSYVLDVHSLAEKFARHRLFAEEVARVQHAMLGERPPADASTVDFVRYWMMSSDEPVNAWEREFAASIEARFRSLSDKQGAFRSPCENGAQGLPRCGECLTCRVH